MSLSIEASLQGVWRRYQLHGVCDTYQGTPTSERCSWCLASRYRHDLRWLVSLVQSRLRRGGPGVTRTRGAGEIT